MDALAYRLVLAFMALSLALAVALVPVWPTALHFGVALGGAASIYALSAALRGRLHRPIRPSPVLLRRMALRKADAGLPSLCQQRHALAEALAADANTFSERDAPPTRAAAVARILSRMLDSWQITNVAALPREMTLALTLLEQVLTADPGEAGRIAQMFQRPDVVLGLRSEIDKIAEVRAEYDRALAAFQATRSMQAADPAPQNLRQALQSLGAADIDLWHRIICEHDPADMAQRRAALWCLAQPACDRASVARFFARLAQSAQLQTAYRKDDKGFLVQVRGIIDNCNAGLYRQQGLAYTPSADNTDQLSAELDALAALSASERWPDPQCVFVEMEGRAPRARPAWDLAQGRLTAPPHRADYL